MASNVQNVKPMNIGFFRGIELDVRIAVISLVSQAEQYSNNRINLFRNGTEQSG